MTPLVLAIPSKGRLMESAAALLEHAGLRIERRGAERGYRGTLIGLPDVEIAFLSAAEIARHLRDGKADLGVTGEDLLREELAPADLSAEIVLRLGFGAADVIVAVPECWLDVDTMGDVDEISASFYERHGRRLRVATKYINLTRRFFAAKGVTGYRIVASPGATEGAPATGVAEIIADITTTGTTLAANNLKVLDDGVILKSEAVLAARRSCMDDERTRQLVDRLSQALKLADIGHSDVG